VNASGDIGRWLQFAHRNKKIIRIYREIDNIILHRNIHDDIRSLEMEGMRSRERRRNSTEPRGELASRTLAMPADCNPRGDIFGGWIMALMDSAGKMSATPHAGGRVVTVSVSNITFLQPVHVGDTVCCYTEVTRRGRTSITLDVAVWVLRQGHGERVKVTEAEFTFVAVGEDGRPRELASSVALAVSKRARQSGASR
jgi:acyl-CoA thioesterase YciA